ncbi:MAG: SWIM zinc finger family protein [Dehalococcoidia bacterium]
MTEPFDPTAFPSLAGLGDRLRGLAGDGAYAAGRDYFRRLQVGHAVVAGATAHATVTGASEYRVSVAFGGEVTPSCTCPAHRRNRFCKHVVAVCTALVERPERFTVREGAPESPPRPVGRGGAARKGKGEKKDAAGATRAVGLETVDRVLEELAAGGLMTLGPDKVALLGGAGELVRALKLRRLGNGILALERAATADPAGAIDGGRFAALLMDLHLTRRASSAVLDGVAAIDPRLAEDLLGKTWREADLEPVTGLELVELYREVRRESEFTIESVHLADVATGAIYVERQIAPHRRFAPAAQRRLLLTDAARLYPVVAPRRIRLGAVRPGCSPPPTSSDWWSAPLPRWSTCAGWWPERLCLPFRTPAPALFRPAARARDDRFGATDRDGGFVALAWPAAWRKDMPALLPEAGRYALAGAVDGEGARPVFRCHAVVGALRWGDGAVYPAN